MQFILFFYRIIEYIVLYIIALGNYFTDEASTNGFRIVLIICGGIINIPYIISCIFHEFPWFIKIFLRIGVETYYIPSSQTLK